MATWPTFAAREPTARRSRIQKRDVFESASGKEVVRRIWAAPRYRYDLTYNLLRTDVVFSAPGQGYDGMTERAALEWLAAQSGTHAYVDPVDGVTRNVRVLEDTLDFEEIDVTGQFSCRLSLISVL